MLEQTMLEQAMQDNALLTQYTQNSSEAAFSQIIARHLPLVYRTCRRELGSETLAEDAAQVVFLLLARKAKSLHAGPSLAGWLYQTAVFVAKDVRKQEARRLRREQAVMQETIHTQEVSALEWDTVEPLLNNALSALKPADRDAVLLRFLEGHTLAETGAFLNITEDAARMRCARALEKLSRYLTAHGAAVTSLALTGLLTAEAIHPIPVHAAEVITQGMLRAISAGPTGNVLLLSKGVSHTMKIIKLKYAVLAASSLLVLGTIPFVSRAAPTRSSKASQLLQVNDTAKAGAPGNALSHWQYPQGSGYGAQLAVVTTPNFPYECLQGTTHDPIEKAYAFYRQKATNGLGVEHGFNWDTNAETTLLVNQPMIGGNPGGGIGFTGLGEMHHNPDHALMIVHQPTQTVVVKLSRDAQNQSWTDIAIVLDKR